MPDISARHVISVVSACMTADGKPTFVLNTVEVTKEEEENGIHYYLAEAALLEAGYEQEPVVHFDESEAPPFLHAAVRRHLGLSPASNQKPQALAEAS